MYHQGDNSDPTKSGNLANSRLNHPRGYILRTAHRYSVPIGTRFPTAATVTTVLPYVISARSEPGVSAQESYQLDGSVSFASVPKGYKLPPIPPSCSTWTGTPWRDGGMQTGGPDLACHRWQPHQAGSVFHPGPACRRSCFCGTVDLGGCPGVTCASRPWRAGRRLRFCLWCRCSWGWLSIAPITICGVRLPKRG